MKPRAVVIGAGIIGAAVTDALALSDTSLTLVEGALAPGSGTSSSSLAWINANKTTDPTYFAMRVSAMQSWEQTAAEFGHANWYVRNGNLTWAETNESRDELLERASRLESRGYPARVVSHAESNRIEPSLRIPHDALIAHFPSEAYVHAARAAMALVERSKASGARIVLGDHVVALEQREGKAWGVYLASGERLECDIVVCATGWQSNDLLSSVGLSIPIIDARTQRSVAPCLVACATAPSRVLRGVVHAPEVYMRRGPRDDLLLEASDIDASIDMGTSQPGLARAAEELFRRALRILPALSGHKPKCATRCIRPLPVDGFPLVGWYPRVNGLYVLATHSGVTLAPYLAKAASIEILKGQRVGLPPAYGLDRAAYND